MIAMHPGQQTALVLFTSVIGYRARFQTVQGTALALATTKYLFAPLAAVLLARRAWTAVGVLVSAQFW